MRNEKDEVNLLLYRTRMELQYGSTVRSTGYSHSVQYVQSDRVVGAATGAISNVKLHFSSRSRFFFEDVVVVGGMAQQNFFRWGPSLIGA